MAQVAKTVTRKGKRMLYICLCHLTTVLFVFMVTLVASRLGPRHRALRIEGVPFWATKGDLKRMCERVRAGPVIDGM